MNNQKTSYPFAEFMIKNMIENISSEIYKKVISETEIQFTPSHIYEIEAAEFEVLESKPLNTNN